MGITRCKTDKHDKQQVDGRKYRVMVPLRCLFNIYARRRGWWKKAIIKYM